MTNPDSMQVVHQYTTHHYTFRWDREADIFCPACGVKGRVWIEYRSGYRESPPAYACAACGQHFGYIDYGDDGESYKVIVEQLRSGVTATPTTEQGR